MYRVPASIVSQINGQQNQGGTPTTNQANDWTLFGNNDITPSNMGEGGTEFGGPQGYEPGGGPMPGWVGNAINIGFGMANPFAGLATALTQDIGKGNYADAGGRVAQGLLGNIFGPVGSTVYGLANMASRGITGKTIPGLVSGLFGNGDTGMGDWGAIGNFVSDPALVGAETDTFLGPGGSSGSGTIGGVDGGEGSGGNGYGGLSGYGDAIYGGGGLGEILGGLLGGDQGYGGDLGYGGDMGCGNGDGGLW